METHYADNYEELTGRKRDGSVRDSDEESTVAETKVVKAPAKAAPKSNVKAETK